jgi:hypothetical protein
MPFFCKQVSKPGSFGNKHKVAFYFFDLVQKKTYFFRPSMKLFPMKKYKKKGSHLVKGIKFVSSAHKKSVRFEQYLRNASNSSYCPCTTDLIVKGVKKKKGKVVPLRSIEAHLGDRRYSSYSFLTSALF